MLVYSACAVVLLYIIIMYPMLGLIERYFDIIMYFKIGEELMCQQNTKLILGPEGLNFNL